MDVCNLVDEVGGFLCIVVFYEVGSYLFVDVFGFVNVDNGFFFIKVLINIGFIG